MSSYGIGSFPKNTRRRKWTRVGKEETKPSCPWWMMPRVGAGAAQSWRSQGASGRCRAVHHRGRGEMTCPPGGRQRGQWQPACTSGRGERQRWHWQEELSCLVFWKQTDSGCCPVLIHKYAYTHVYTLHTEQCQRKQYHINKTSFSCLFPSVSVLHAYFTFCCWEGRGPEGTEPAECSPHLSPFSSPRGFPGPCLQWAAAREVLASLSRKQQARLGFL